MSLPRPPLPYYNCIIPSTKKKIKYRPYTVLEEKVLMLAAESGDPGEIVNALETTISRCVDGPIDVRELAIFDIEYLFLRLRAKSVGEKIELRTIAPDDGETPIDITIDIDKVGVEILPNHTNKIKFDDNFMVVMKYPNIDFFNEGLDLSNIEATSELIAKCISQIVYGEEVTQANDTTLEERVEWVEGLTSAQFIKLEQFFKEMPRLKHTVKTTNPITKNKVEIQLVGLSDFFT